MTFNYTILFQISISVFSLFFNLLGIFCLRKQKSGNKNQYVLLQNLALVEVVKTLFDYIPLVLYHFNHAWYVNHRTYLEVCEVGWMSVLFSAYMFITLDRLLCVTLKTRYKTLVTHKLIKKLLIASWLLASIPGLLGWSVWGTLEPIKWYYYITLEGFICVLMCATYFIIMVSFRQRKRKLSSVAEGLKFPTVPFLLMGSFVAFNVVPDVVFTFHQNDMTFHIVSFLWTSGYLIDPLLYIFPGQHMRTSAVNIMLSGFKSLRTSAQPFTKLFCGRTQREVDISLCRESVKISTLVVYGQNGVVEISAEGEKDIVQNIC